MEEIGQGVVGFGVYSGTFDFGALFAARKLFRVARQRRAPPATAMVTV